MKREALDTLTEIYSDLADHWHEIARDASRDGDIYAVYEAVKEARAAGNKAYTLRQRYIHN